MNAIYISFTFLIFLIILLGLLINKKFLVISFILYVIYLIFFCIKFFDNEYYQIIINDYENIEEYVIIYGGVISIISLIEFIFSNKNNKYIQKNIDFSNICLSFINSIDELCACCYDNKYIINNKMKEYLEVNSNIIENNIFKKFIYYLDLDSNSDTFRLENNKIVIYFKKSVFNLNNKEILIIKQMKEDSNDILTIHKYSELYNYLSVYCNDFIGLFNINLININDIRQTYKEITNVIINKYLSGLINLPFLNNPKIFKIDDNQYILLIEKEIEYNIILENLEDSNSKLINQKIELVNTIIEVKTKIGIVSSNEIKDKNKIIEESFNMVNLAKDKDFPGDYAFYTNEQLENDPFKDLNIDLDLIEIRNKLK